MMSYAPKQLDFQQRIKLLVLNLKTFKIRGMEIICPIQQDLLHPKLLVLQMNSSKQTNLLRQLLNIDI